uniref:C2H2-type domain-containing protein n=1 Tax=Gasterosteus aculeatus aculeatus TaxID=481459 RepID=G3NW10_GASAC
MNDKQDRPYVCGAPSCSQRFPSEEHLVIHRRKHEMSLKFSSIKTDTAFTDQTPTPTRFLQNCEEVGLFKEIEEEFLQAQEEEKSKQASSGVAVLPPPHAEQTKATAAGLPAWHPAGPRHARGLCSPLAHREANVVFNGFTRSSTQPLLLLAPEIQTGRGPPLPTAPPNNGSHQQPSDIYGSHDGNDVTAPPGTSTATPSPSPSSSATTSSTPHLPAAMQWFTSAASGKHPRPPRTG